VTSLILGAVATGGAVLFADRLPLAPEHQGSLLVPASLATVLTGFLILATRRKAITQVVGYLVLENGIFIMGLTLHEAMPSLVEVGVLLDLLVAIFVIGIVINHISREFASLDVARLDTLKDGPPHEAVAARVQEARDAFASAMQDDLNTSGALGAMFELVSALNSAIDAGEVSAGDVTAIRETFGTFDRVLGILTLRRQEDERPPVPVEEIERLIEARHAARRRRDFGEADRIRDELAARGVLLEDSAGGTRWKRK